MSSTGPMTWTMVPVVGVVAVAVMVTTSSVEWSNRFCDQRTASGEQHSSSLFADRCSPSLL
jgi:hypothetical protein